jgi:hypothetical protein
MSTSTSAPSAASAAAAAASSPPSSTTATTAGAAAAAAAGGGGGGGGGAGATGTGTGTGAGTGEASGVLEREIIRRFESRIQSLAEERVAAYAASPEFVALVEELKRKKREEMLARCMEGFVMGGVWCVCVLWVVR